MLRRIVSPGLLIPMVATVTCLGVFYPGGGSTREAISPRGQQFSLLSTGIYRLNPVSFAREGRVWDVVNLLIAVLLFVVAWVAAARHSLRVRLLLGGMQAYSFYVYLSSVMVYAFNELFLVYVRIVALSSITFLQTMTDLRIDQIPTSISGRFPRMLSAGYPFVLAASLLILWTARILSILRTGLMPVEYAGLTTLGSQALDLGLLVPLAAATGVQLVKDTPLGRRGPRPPSGSARVR